MCVCVCTCLLMREVLQAWLVYMESDTIIVITVHYHSKLEISQLVNLCIRFCVMVWDELVIVIKFRKNSFWELL